jgi:hypothetical protein
MMNERFSGGCMGYMFSQMFVSSSMKLRLSASHLYSASIDFSEALNYDLNISWKTSTGSGIERGGC